MQFRIDLDRASQRTLRVALTLDVGQLAGTAIAAGAGSTVTGSSEAAEHEFFLPVWTPGSYLVREYARHLGGFQARDAATGEGLSWRKSAKNRYAVAPGAARRVRLEYEVYAHELSVRTNYATDAFAYWNGAATLLWPVGLESAPARVDVVVPDGWRLVTGRGDPRPVPDLPDTWTFECADLDEAVDTPCLAGAIEEFAFESRGRRHRLCAVGLEGVAPPATFTDDVRRAVEAAGAVFPGELPFDEYVFLALFGGAGRGGLEHASSSTLLAPRMTFEPRTSYEDFLALAAHEYFHVWNVKRMRPAELWTFDYERENHTELLWVAEGFTAYYDDLALRRAGLTTARRYLDVLGNHIRGMLTMSGRFAQSLAESSYDAWIRFYRPDENTRNATQNYYANGALAALCLDSAIRSATGGARSLDDALRALWAATFQQGRGYTHADVAAALRTAAGQSLDALVDALTRGPFEPDLDHALALYGLRLERGEPKPWIGVQFRSGTSEVAVVHRDAPAWYAGVCPGDELIGVAGLRVDGSRFGDVWPVVAQIGAPVEMLVARQGRLLTMAVEPEGRGDHEVRIRSVEAPGEVQLAYREAWLGVRDV